MSKPFTLGNKQSLHQSTAISIALEKQGGYHYISIAQIRPSDITSGRKAVSNAGTAETLVATSTPCLYVDVCADLGNTTPIVVGGSGVVAANDSQEGIVLTSGNPPIRIYIDDVQKLYVDTQTNGDAVCFNYATA